jgi:hypothetical protein
MAEHRAKAAVADPAHALATFALHLSIDAHAWVEVTGSSMNPLIHAGDALYVEFGGQRPRLGEIVVFWENSRMVVHRLVHRRRTVDGEVLVTRGDASLLFDREFPADQLFGVVRACRRADTGNLTPIAGRGSRAGAVGRLSAAAGWVVAGVDRLPAPLHGPVSHSAQRLTRALVASLARLVARTEGPDSYEGPMTASSSTRAADM